MKTNYVKFHAIHIEAEADTQIFSDWLQERAEAKLKKYYQKGQIDKDSKNQEEQDERVILWIRKEGQTLIGFALIPYTRVRSFKAKRQRGRTAISVNKDNEKDFEFEIGLITIDAPSGEGYYIEIGSPTPRQVLTELRKLFYEFSEEMQKKFKTKSEAYKKGYKQRLGIDIKLGATKETMLDLAEKLAEIKCASLSTKEIITHETLGIQKLQPKSMYIHVKAKVHPGATNLREIFKKCKEALVSIVSIGGKDQDGDFQLYKLVGNLEDNKTKTTAETYKETLQISIGTHVETTEEIISKIMSCNKAFGILEECKGHIPQDWMQISLGPQPKENKLVTAQ